MRNQIDRAILPLESELIAAAPAVSTRRNDEETRILLGPLPSRSNGQSKRIWIDIDNSPHVPFFLPIIEGLEKRGFQITLTARDMYQVCELLEYFKVSSYKVIGKHYGKNKFRKVMGAIVRTCQLLPTATTLRPHLALSHGSRAQILACKALGITTVMVHDYEHSTKTGFIEPDWVLMPEVIPDKVMSRNPERTLRFPGIKEDVYVPRFVPDPSILRELGISQEELIVTIRPPATEAHYHNPESDLLFAETLQFLAENQNVRAVILPRNGRQERQLQREWATLSASGRVMILTKPVNGLNLIWFSDLVISGGGTMNREAAALGVPVYSIFRGTVGAVDKYLVDKGRLTLLESVQDVRTKIRLARWKRPAHPGKGDQLALMNIVENIAAISEGKCPQPNGIALRTLKASDIRT